MPLDNLTREYCPPTDDDQDELGTERCPLCESTNVEVIAWTDRHGSYHAALRCAECGSDTAADNFAERHQPDPPTPPVGLVYRKGRGWTIRRLPHGDFVLYKRHPKNPIIEVSAGPLSPAEAATYPRKPYV
jgi:hypothetical protein